MKIRILFTSLSMLILVVGMVYAQSPYRDTPSRSTSEFLRNPVSTTPLEGILDPSRITMNHQVGMTYSSLGGTGYSQGYYMNSLSYRFNAPLRLNLRLGLTNNPFSSQAPGSNEFGPNLGEAEFFGGADLDWKPADNVFVRFSVDRVPAGLYYNNAYSPYSRHPYSALNYLDPYDPYNGFIH